MDSEKKTFGVNISKRRIILPVLEGGKLKSQKLPTQLLRLASQYKYLQKTQ
jgi:hypothetical protein